MSLLRATLTLPGIAGIVLTLGMAIDANILIFSRIKEELKRGVPFYRSLRDGFDKALPSIIDSNLTTLLVGIVLYALGTGPVKGFAVTLSVGILTSIFTATTVTHGILHLLVGNQTKLGKVWL
jgi:preprotein translocase subunit SecD